MKKECYMVYVELTIVHEATYSKIQDKDCKVFLSRDKAIKYKEKLVKKLPPNSTYEFYNIKILEKEIEDFNDDL